MAHIVLPRPVSARLRGQVTSNVRPHQTAVVVPPMSNEQWRTFFLICARVLGRGSSQSWCVWTTFGNLLHYWSAGLPAESELAPECTRDGGTWGQPFRYQDIAHIAIPAQFYWERIAPGEFSNGTRRQDITTLSESLAAARIPHRKTELVLELKFY